MVLPKTAGGGERDCARRACSQDHGSPHAAGGDPRARRCAGVAGDRHARSTRRARDADNYGDRWLSRAMYIAAHAPQGGVPRRVQGRSRRRCRSASLPIALRIGATQARLARARRRRRSSTDWKDMQVPGNWEARGLPRTSTASSGSRGRSTCRQGAGETSAVARPHRQHRRGVGQRPVGDADGSTARAGQPRPAAAGAAAGRGAGGGRGRAAAACCRTSCRPAR